MEIEYVEGDATDPQTDGLCVLPHICNDLDKWGAGYTAHLDARWDYPREAYHAYMAANRPPGWPSRHKHLVMGSSMWIPCLDGKRVVVNMHCQEGVGRGRDRVNYRALRACLQSVRNKIMEVDPTATVHMPKIGTGLAGGDWIRIAQMVTGQLTDKGISTTVYTWPSEY